MSSQLGVDSAIQAAAAIVVATLQFLVAKQAQDRLDELASYTIYNLQVDKARSEQFKPCIDQVLTDMCATPYPVSQIDAITARSYATIETALARGIKKSKECSSIYCAPLSRANIAMLAVQAGASKVEVGTAERRKEEMRVRLLRDAAIERKLAVGKATRGNFDGSINASRALTDLYSKQSAAALDGLSGSLKTAGYLAKREFGNETKDRGAPTTNYSDKDAPLGYSEADRVDRSNETSYTTPSITESPTNEGVGGGNKYTGNGAGGGGDTSRGDY